MIDLKSWTKRYSQELT